MKFILLLSITFFAQAEFKKPDIPHENQMKCFKKACSIVGRWDCKNDWDRKKLLDACTRQQDINCFYDSLRALSTFEADDVFEVSTIAKSCQYVDSSALTTSKKYLKTFDYDELNEVSRFNDAHWLSSSTCLKDVYNKVSTFSLDVNDLERAARSCGGSYSRGCLTEICKHRGHFGCDELDEVTEVLKHCVYAPTPAQRRDL